MNKIYWLIAFFCHFGFSQNVLAIEEAKYHVLYKEGDIEIRQYEQHILAEILVEADIEQAGNEAFRPLFNYISGNNSSQSDIAMTAPVSQQISGKKIAMTAPVSQKQSGNEWVVSFMMPATYTLETLPLPNDPRINLRRVPEQLMATIRYSGFWTEEKYQQYKIKLENWIYQSDYKTNGQPIWARYNAPYTLWFLRRNEVLIPLKRRN